MIRQIIFFAAIGLTLTACVKDKTIEPVPVPTFLCTDTVSFENDLLVPLFNTSCNTSGCHSGADAAASYVFEAHDLISVNSTVILKVINHDATVSPMPKGGEKLADSLIQKFDCWIQQGKLNN